MENVDAQRPRMGGAPAKPPPADVEGLPHPILAEAGLALAPDGTFTLRDAFVFRTVVERAARRPGVKEELIGALSEAWIEPDALRNALQPTRSAAPTHGGAVGSEVKESVVRLLLQCAGVQTEVGQMLIQMLPDHQEELEDAAPRRAGMPIANLVLSQFRWLEHVVDGAALLGVIGEILQVADPALRRELVLVLPDVIVDGQHTDAVTLLADLLREDSQFTAPVLEALSSLHLEKHEEEEVCALVTASVASSRAADLPAIIRFLLQHLGADNASETSLALRSCLSREFLTDASERTGDAEALVLDAFLSALRLRSDLANQFLGQLEAVKRAADLWPFDWWLVTAVLAAGDSKSRTRATRLVAEWGAKAMMKLPMMRAAIVGHGVALRSHYPAQLSLAAGLLRNATSAHARSLGSGVYQALFEEFAEPYERQEMICQMLTHIGVGVATEVDTALEVLVELATREPAQVAMFSSFITGVLDYLDGLSVPQARLAFELFARIAYDTREGGSRLADELHITIRKQLTSTAPRYKSLGVLGGCCLLGRLGARKPASAGTGTAVGAQETAVPATLDEGSMAEETEEDGATKMDPVRKADAEALLSLMLKYATAPDGSFGFLLHELSLLVAARAPSADAASQRGVPVLESELIELVIERITSSFESTYLHDIEALPIEPPHIRGIKPALALSLDGEDAQIAVNVLPLLELAEASLTGVAQRHALCTLSATFQLLRVCEAAVSQDGNELEAVDAVLGCPFYLFDEDVLEGFAELPVPTKETVCLALFYTIDFVRELINAFCTQRDHELRKKVLARLKQLLWMERALDRCLGLTPSFRLPTAIVGEGTAKAAKASKAKEPAPRRKPAAKPAGKGKAKAKAAGHSDVGSDSDDEPGIDPMDAETGAHEAAEGAAGGAAGGAGASSSAAPPKADAKAPKVAPATSTLPALSNLARVLPYLRGLSVDVCTLLTFTSSVEESPESEELELTELLTAPSVHYLVSHLHASVRTGLQSAGRPFALSAPTANSKTRLSTTGQDLSSMELCRLGPHALLARLHPALCALGRHAKMLSEIIPGILELPSHVFDYGAAYGGSESEAKQSRFVEPTLLTMMQALRKLLECKQLADDASQQMLVAILASCGAEAGEHVSVSQAAVSTAVASCCAGFDFFDLLIPKLPNIALQAEVIGLCKAILEFLSKFAPSDAEAILERRQRLATLASGCLTRERADSRELSDWNDKPPSTLLVKTLFEVEVEYCPSPSMLLEKWTAGILPALRDADVTDGGFATEECPLLTRKSAPHFVSTLFAMLTDEAKRLPFQPPKASRKPKRSKGGDKGGDADDDDDDDEEEVAAAEEVIGRLHELCKAFVELVSSTRFVDTATRKKDGTSTSVGRALNKKAIEAAFKFIGIINKKAVPVMTCHFRPLSEKVMGLLKSLQPATRLLQVHCTMVKERLQTAALAPAALLKRELETLVFQVKVLLQANNCHEGFWMGNLKHKSIGGQELSSQMAVEAAEPKEPKTPKEPKPRKSAKGKRKADEVEQILSQIVELDGGSGPVDEGGEEQEEEVCYEDEDEEDEDGEEGEEEEDDDDDEY